MGVISETGCSASPDGDLLRNRWKPEDLLLEVVVFGMLSNSAEGDFKGCPCSYMHTNPTFLLSSGRYKCYSF